MPKDRDVPQRSLSVVSLHPSPPSMRGGPWAAQRGEGIRELSPASNQLLFFKRKSLDLFCSGAAFLLRWINLKQRKKFIAKIPWEGNRGWPHLLKQVVLHGQRRDVGLEMGSGGRRVAAVRGQHGTGHLGGMMPAPSKPTACSHRGGKGPGPPWDMQPFLS